MPEMNETELRTLFQAAGHDQAPTGLHAAVMDQVLAHQPISEVEPLISSRAWIMAVVLLIATTALSWVLSRYAHVNPASGFTLPFEVELSSIGNYLHHATWIAMAMGLILAVTLLDRSLARTHPRSAH